MLSLNKRVRESPEVSFCSVSKNRKWVNYLKMHPKQTVQAERAYGDSEDLGSESHLACLHSVTVKSKNKIR